MLHQKMPKMPKNIFGKKVTYHAVKKSNYEQHCKTIKHNATKCYIKNANFICSKKLN